MPEPEGTNPMPKAPKEPSMGPVDMETEGESPKKASEGSEKPKHHESPRLKLSLKKEPPPPVEEEDRSDSEEGQITEKPSESPVKPEPPKEEKKFPPPATPQPESSSDPIKEDGEEEEPMESKGKEEPKKEEEKEEDSKMEVDDSEKVDGEEDEKPVEDNDNDNEGSRGDGEGSQGDAGEESTASKASELPYSTRGRTTTGNEPAGSESWERSTREALDDLGRVKETPATLGTSFLEALSEEERRTRTRFLPNVEGMHVLRKFEVKDDLALARSIASGDGVTSLASSKKKGKRARDDDGMDVDEDEGTSPSEDDHGSDVGRLGTTTIELPSRDLVVPSNAFIAPPGSQSSSSNGDADGPKATTAPSKGPKDTISPLLVEFVTAFNPPRPPESIGAKKKHRMLRWERRPEDVEVDLSNYRKTVARTRQELHNAESEYERLETIDAHLRWHFLGHLNLLNEEYLRLNEELSGVQQECVKAADLLTSRTRSRGAGKGSYVMKDVLAVLKARGAEGTDQDAAQSVESSTDAPAPCSVGIGGLSNVAFSDWDQETCFSSRKPANAWVVPGDTVQTSYGEGTVLEVRAVVTPTISGEPVPVHQNGSKGDSTKSPGKRKKEKMAVIDTALSKLNTVASPSVRVQMPYGVGHFPLASLTSKVDPSVYSDTQLATRWKGMLESALTVGPCLDVEGMLYDTAAAPAVKDVVDGRESDESAPMDTENGAAEEDKDEENSRPSDKGPRIAKSKFLPFGAGLLPTSTGRGSLLHDLPTVDIEKGLNSALFDGWGVLGKTTNPGETPAFKKLEEEQQEHCTLDASVLQLGNQLYRQRRIRLLNERTYAATRERSHRVEGLVSEMRADLKSLKHRLEEELHELGIDEETAESIFISFYREQDASGGRGEASPPKFQRRMLRPDEDEGMVDESVDGGRFSDQPVDGVSVNDQGVELSGDDPEAQKASKKLRPNQ